MSRQFRAILTIFLLCGLPAGATMPALAQEKPSGELANTLEQNTTELTSILREKAVSEKRTEELKREVEKLRNDKATLTTEIIQAAKTEKKLAVDVLDLEDSLVDLARRSDDIHASLLERRALLAEVLAALQRMGLNPPPAILVSPEDALSSVRSSILLSSVVPDMRDETRELIADLTELKRLTATYQAERDRLEATLERQKEEQVRLSLLLDEKKALESKKTAALEEERARAAELAEKAESLQDLISSIETEIASAREAAEQARLDAERRLQEGRQRAEERASSVARLSPAYPFSDLRGKLSKPVAGRIITAFGDDDGLGGVAQGDTIEAAPGAYVTAPADGWVLYAGPFRSYGQLLILNTGDDYHMVLAGMDRITVSQGQFVLAGEPVGVMGRVHLASVSAAAAANEDPTLYVEFRRNGKPVNPNPWWEEVGSGRT